MIKHVIALLLLFAVGTLFTSLLFGYVPDSELNQTARYYAERTAGDVGAANIVTAIVVTYRGPEKEDDREQQVSLVQNLVSARYDAIVLAPLDSKALLAPVRQARQAGIEVVIMDSALEGEPGADFASFVATDSEAGGRLAGERMATLLPDGGKVLLLRYLEGSASTAAREDRDIGSWLGELRRKTAPRRPAAADHGTDSAEPTNVLASGEPTNVISAPDDATRAIPTANTGDPLSAEETRAIPVSRPQAADSEVATEQLNARGQHSGGGVSAQDLLRREGRI